MMTKEQYSQNYRQGHTIATTHDIAAAAHGEMLMEWISTAEQVLDEALELVGGDVDNLYDGERSMFELYATWDGFYQGRHQTSAQLIEKHGGKPLIKLPADTHEGEIHEAEEEEDDDSAVDS